MITDSASLGWRIWRSALRCVRRRRSCRLATRGWEIVAAFVNALFMLVIIGWIVFKAVGRLIGPTPVAGETVTLVATLGLFVNLLVAWLIMRDQTSMNARAALVHVMGDCSARWRRLSQGLRFRTRAGCRLTDFVDAGGGVVA